MLGEQRLGVLRARRRDDPVTVAGCFGSEEWFEQMSPGVLMVGGGVVRIDVTDQGTPMLDAERERVFDRDVPLALSGNRSGFGLYLCKLLVVRHGGQISAHALSDGMRFSFTLPSSSAGPA